VLCTNNCAHRLVSYNNGEFIQTEICCKSSFYATMCVGLTVSVLVQSETLFRSHLTFCQFHVTASDSTKGLPLYTYMLLAGNYSDLIVLQRYHLFPTAIMSTGVAVQDRNMSTSNPETCNFATDRGDRDVSRSLCYGSVWFVCPRSTCSIVWWPPPQSDC